MATIKVTKKHHKHLNNPFPSTPTSLPFIRGSLLFNPQTLPSHHIYSFGKDFQLAWSSDDGGSISIHHRSQPTRPIWSTIPGQAFVSAALAETEVEESRGSFVVKDGHVHLVCNHQSIQDIMVINQVDDFLEGENHVFPSGYFLKSHAIDTKGTQFPLLLITGWIFSGSKKSKGFQKSGRHESIPFGAKGPSTSARYWVLFDQKSSDQIGFQVKLGHPDLELRPKASLNTIGRYRGFRRRIRRFHRRKLAWCWSFAKRRGFVMISSSEEEIDEMKTKESREFNRVCFTYSSEANERFYGFGEQFSRMDFKGKRVPIFVQEQGIGRGDQPITFAANLISYRYAECQFLSHQYLICH